MLGEVFYSAQSVSTLMIDSGRSIEGGWGMHSAPAYSIFVSEKHCH